MKRVALYYPWLYVRSGVERVILELARRSRHEYTVFTSHVDYDQTFPEVATLKRLVVLDRVPVERSFLQVARAALRIATLKLDLRSFDALVVSSEGLGDLVTFRNHSRPVICFCHTPVRPIYDPVYRREWLERHPRARAGLAVFGFCYALVTRLAWRHYRRVFVNSREVAARVLAGRLCPPERVEVLHPGVALERIRRPAAFDRVFLYAGRIKWTKNVELAIEAFRHFKREFRDSGGWRLIVAGSVDGASRDYLAGLTRLVGGDAAIEFRLNPSDDDLSVLYDSCYALVYPSLNEDWGMVPLEAMAHGKAVLAVNSGGPTESVEDGRTGFLLEPRAAAFAGRMAWLAERPAVARSMGAAGAERVKAWSWEAFVTRLDDYVERHC